MGVFAAISRTLCGVLCASALTVPAAGQVTFIVTFEDPDGLLAPWAEAIQSNMNGAGGLWATRLRGETELWIEVRPSTQIAEWSCRSFTWSYYETLEGAIDVFETGASVHVRNGFPASTFDPDIVLELNPAFVQDELWFDPDPVARTEAVESTRVDAVSVFARGLGHALAFDGWMNGTDGTFPGTARSTFDQLVVFDGTEFSFTGANAVAAYAAPVPITFGKPFHLGNEPPRPGTGLLNDLMGGSPIVPGTRFGVSDLDFAILRDARVPIRMPCPCDLNGDGFVEDEDFLLFSTSYDLFDCTDPLMPANCPSDFNSDAGVDDTDYVIFVHSYAELVCP